MCSACISNIGTSQHAKSDESFPLEGGYIMRDCFLLHWGRSYINYIMLKGRGEGISQCDDVYIKHTSVWDNV